MHEVRCFEHKLFLFYAICSQSSLSHIKKSINLSMRTIITYCYLLEHFYIYFIQLWNFHHKKKSALCDVWIWNSCQIWNEINLYHNNYCCHIGQCHVARNYFDFLKILKCSGEEVVLFTLKE